MNAGTFVTVQGDPKVGLKHVVAEALFVYRQRFGTDPAALYVPPAGAEGEPLVVEGFTVQPDARLRYDDSHNWYWQAAAGPVPEPSEVAA